MVALLQVSWITRDVSSGSSSTHEIRIEEQQVRLRGTVSLAPTFYPTRNEHQGRWQFQIAHVVLESHPESGTRFDESGYVFCLWWSNELITSRGEEVLIEGTWSSLYFPGSAAYNYISHPYISYVALQSHSIYP